MHTRHAPPRRLRPFATRSFRPVERGPEATALVPRRRDGFIGFRPRRACGLSRKMQSHGISACRHAQSVPTPWAPHLASSRPLDNAVQPPSPSNWKFMAVSPSRGVGTALSSKHRLRSRVPSPDATVAARTRAFGPNENLVHNWRRGRSDAGVPRPADFRCKGIVRSKPLLTAG